MRTSTRVWVFGCSVCVMYLHAQEAVPKGLDMEPRPRRLRPQGRAPKFASSRSSRGRTSKTVRTCYL
ncbi:hypothetical protein NL676_026556 [Syzygium grande]|nr:hypothetical protein NL676_026556 [Syzygium grande]